MFGLVFNNAGPLYVGVFFVLWDNISGVCSRVCLVFSLTSVNIHSKAKRKYDSTYTVYHEKLHYRRFV